MINLKINNVPVSVEPGTTILQAAKSIGIKIPTLCYLKDINEIGACRVCVVEVKGARNLVASCVYPVNEGMEVFTNSERVLQARKTTIELLLSNHRKECLANVTQIASCKPLLTSTVATPTNTQAQCAPNRKTPPRSISFATTPSACCVVVALRCVIKCKKSAYTAQANADLTHTSVVRSI